MKRFKRKALCLLTACSMFAVGSCTIDSWNLAIGPGFGDQGAFGGVELEFSNGVDVLVPLVSLGDGF